jgi:hypothetical protein
MAARTCGDNRIGSEIEPSGDASQKEAEKKRVFALDYFASAFVLRPAVAEPRLRSRVVL